MSMTLSRRKVERKDCLLDARAYVDGQPAVRCSVRNITPQGAKLMTESALAARKMLLFLPAIGAVWAAQVRWRQQYFRHSIPSRRSGPGGCRKYFGAGRLRVALAGGPGNRNNAATADTQHAEPARASPARRGLKPSSSVRRPKKPAGRTPLQKSLQRPQHRLRRFLR